MNERLVAVLRDILRVLMGIEERQREYKECTMAAIDDLETKIGTLTQLSQDQSAKIDAADAKADLVIAALTDVRAQLTVIEGTATGLDPRLVAVSAGVDAAIATLTADNAKIDAESAKEDGALNPATDVPATPAATA